MNNIIYNIKLFINQFAYNWGIISRDTYFQNQFEIRFAHHADQLHQLQDLANNALEHPLDFLDNAIYNAADHVIDNIGDNIDNTMEYINDFFGH